MSRLEGAMDHFSKALGRLEAALNKRNEGDKGASPVRREVQTLRDERQRLSRELEHARADVQALEKVTDEIEDRLDSAIRDVRRVLGAA